MEIVNYLTQDPYDDVHINSASTLSVVYWRSIILLFQKLEVFIDVIPLGQLPIISASLLDVYN